MNFYHPDKPDNDKTLGEERQRLDAVKRDGTICGACEQSVKWWDRPIRAIWILGLLRMYGLRGTAPWHYSQMEAELRDVVGALKPNETKTPKLPGSDWRFMAQYGLITESTGSGMWEITSLGAWFIDHKNERLIPESITIYNSEVVGKSPNPISLNEACRLIGEFDPADLSKPSTNPVIGLPIELPPSPTTDNPFVF